MPHHKGSYKTNNNTKALFNLDVYPDMSRSGLEAEMDFSSHVASECISTDHKLVQLRETTKHSKAATALKMRNSSK